MKSYANFVEQVDRHNYNNNFGNSTCLYDYNLDGIKDLIIGDQYNDDILVNQGIMYVYLMNAAGTMNNRPDARIYLSPSAASTYFGSSCTVIDMNRDGHDDLVVGTSALNRAYVYLGSGTGLETTPSVTILDPTGDGGLFGGSMTSGDLNNDGFPDLVIGADQVNGAGTDRGRVYIYESNNATGLISAFGPTTFGNGAVNSDAYGRGLAIVDNDGDNELLVGVPGDDTVVAGSGSVIIYDNPSTLNTLITTASSTVLNNPSGLSNDNFGGYILVGNDSSQLYPDLFISSMFDDIAGTNAGATYHFLGSASGITSFIANTFRTLDSIAPIGEELGSGVITHDFNQDGTLDLGIGGRSDDTTGYNSGTYYILLQ